MQPLLTEVSGGEFRLLFQRLAPEFASFIRLALRFERMAQVEQRFREVRTIRQGLLIQADGIFHLTGLLQQQSGVLEELRSAFASLDQLGLQVKSFVQILAFDSQSGQAA